MTQKENKDDKISIMKKDIGKQIKVFGKTSESFKEKKSKLFESSEAYKEGLK